MEFLIHISVQLPSDMPTEERSRLLETEARRGKELIDTGSLKRIWRIPGRWANVSLYEARDGTELHELISSLPLWPWMEVDVEPLARHPLEGHPSEP